MVYQVIRKWWAVVWIAVAIVTLVYLLYIVFGEVQP
jgi:hypothetical protein